MYQRYLIWIVFSALILSCTSGQNSGSSGGNTPGSGSGVTEGDTGVTFQNGTECLSDDASPVSGTTLYVSPNGNDNNSGTSPSSPLKTLVQALCNIQPGQTLRVMPGTYQESVIMGLFGNDTDAIVIQGAGSDGSPLTLQQQVSSSRPVLDGEGTRSHGIALSESTNITVENIEFRNYTDAGLHVLVGSDITIRKNLFIDNGRASVDPDSDGEGFGVSAAGTLRITIEDNEATQNGPSADLVQQGILGTGIDTFGLQDSVIRNNHSHNNRGGGMLVEDSTTVLVEANLLEDNELYGGVDYWDGALWVDGGQDITVRNNTMQNNNGPGLQISDEDLQYPNGSIGYVV